MGVFKLRISAGRELTSIEKGVLERYLDAYSDKSRLVYGREETGEFFVYTLNSELFGVHNVSVVDRGLIVSGNCLRDKSEQDSLASRIMAYYREVIDERVGVGV